MFFLLLLLKASPRSMRVSGEAGTVGGLLRLRLSPIVCLLSTVLVGAVPLVVSVSPLEIRGS